MTYDLNAFFSSVLAHLGAPRTDANLRALAGWHACEGGSAGFNPLNTTLWQPGCSNYNSFGPGGAYHVRNYPDLPTGVRATVLTLTNGHYPHIVAGLRAGDSPYDIVRGEAAHELDVWGTGGGHVRAWLDAHVNHAPPPPPPVHPHHVYVVHGGDTLSGIAERYHVRGGWQALYKANLHAVGGDPNVIHPGTQLVIPA